MPCRLAVSAVSRSAMALAMLRLNSERYGDHVPVFCWLVAEGAVLSWDQLLYRRVALV